MKKRIISLLLCFVMLFTLFSVQAFAADQVRIEGENVTHKLNVGDVVEVPVNVTENPGFIIGKIRVSWDSTALKLTEVSYNGFVPSEMPAPITEGISSYAVPFGKSDATANYTQTGLLFTLKYEVLAGATAKEYPITLTTENTFFQNFDVDDVASVTTNGSVTLTEPAPTTYTVKVNGGTGVSRKTDPANGNSQQTVDQNTAIDPVVFEAWDDYYFPERYGENSGKLGITVTRNSYTEVTVSGIPTANVEIGLPPAAVKHENPDIPSVTPVHCTAAGNDGKITGVDASMEYKKGAIGDTWYIVGNNTEITGLASGTYYVRYKATATQKASAAATVVINDYDPTVEKVTVTYKANGGTGADHSVQVDKGSNHVILGADACGFTAPQGKRFVYWSNTAGNGQGSEHYEIGDTYTTLNDLTLYAVWETTARTVFLNAGEGGGNEISENVTYDQTYTLPGVPETFTAPNGKEFDCWKIEGDNTNTSYNPRDSYTIKGNVRFVAQWKDKQGGGEQPTTFTLTFQPGEGSGDNYVVNGIDTPQYTLPNPGDIGIAPPNDKPNFAGWKAEGGNVVYPAGTVIPVNADATFVAQWKADGPQGDMVLVTFKPGDGTGDAFELRVPAGDSYRLPAKPAGFKAPAGKVFAGWKIEDPQGNLNEKLYKAGHKFDLTEDVTFVAQWKTRPYYGDDTTTPDADPMVNPGTGAAPVGAPIAVVIAVAVAGAAYFVTTKKR